ncbi:MAG: VCBS domain-containing protein, partial [Planctomycetia bacterium]
MPLRWQRSRRSRRLPLKAPRSSLGSQSLEPRLALAFSTFETVTSALAHNSGPAIPAEVTIVDSKELSPADLKRVIGDDPSLLLGRTPGIDSILHRVFASSGTDRATFDLQASSVEEQLLAGSSALGVSFQILDASVLGSHGGAYAAKAPGGPTIFLRSDILSAPQPVVRSIVFEEIGHHLDTLLNHGIDARGDEGEYFSDLVRGVSLTAAEQSRLLAEDDHGFITIGGQQRAVEFNTIDGVARSVRYEEGSDPIPLQPNLTLKRNSGPGEDSPDTITSVLLTIPSATATDRIRVPGAKGDAAGTDASLLADGIAIPVTALPKTNFWLQTGEGTAIRFTAVFTPGGEVTFTAPGTTGAGSFAAFQSLIRSVHFDNTSPSPTTDGRMFTWRIASVVSSSGVSLPVRTLGGTVTITPVNNAPSIDESGAPADLVEQGDGNRGVATTSVTLKKSDSDSTGVRYDTTWLQANGWATADGGSTFSVRGTYGTAILTVATDTVTYDIDDTLPATDNLNEGQTAEDTFTVQVIDTGVANRRAAGRPQTAMKALVFRVIGKADFQTFSDAAPSISYTEKEAPVFLQPTISLHRNTGSGSNAAETITSVALTVPAAVITDRIRVQGAKGDAVGATESKVATGVFVPSVATTATDFWLRNADGGTDKFTAAVTPGETFTFTSAAIGKASFSAFENLLRSVQYDSTSSAPAADPRQLIWVLTRTASDSGVTLPSRKIDQSVSIIPVNDAPLVEVGPSSNDLVEGTTSSAGTDSATVLLTKSDVDSSEVRYDESWLISNGWISVEGGSLYTHAGSYGTASLDVSNDTISYLLDNSLSATDDLSTGETVDDPFTIRVIDDLGASTDASVVFAVQGTTDASVTPPNTPPTVTASPASNPIIEAGALVTGVNTATASFTLTSPDSTVAIDTAWLTANGWTTPDAGLTYTT